MKILFLMPLLATNPIGGYKVIFAQANGLVNQGHEVTIAFPVTVRDQLSFYHWLGRLRYTYRAQRQVRGKINWFPFDERIKLLVIPDQRSIWIRGHFDASVAVGWESAQWVAAGPKRWGRKYYYIMHYEQYMSADATTKQQIESTYHLPLEHFVLSPVIADLLLKITGKKPPVVALGVDSGEYQLQLPISDPGRILLGFPNRPETHKRTADAVAVMTQVKQRLPEIKVWCFGRNNNLTLPDWINDYRTPSSRELCELYNKTAVFVTPSDYEGWGLPGMEAMVCGAALVTTDHGGVRAYARSQYNALFSPPRDIHGMVDHVLQLWNEPSYRMKLAQQGQQDTAQFTWDAATRQLIDVLSTQKI